MKGIETRGGLHSFAQMLGIFRRLGLGLLLIAATSALLLLSDLRSRVKPVAAVTTTTATPAAVPVAPTRVARVALLQHASQAVLDHGRDGMLAGLAEQGWREGVNLDLKRYNAQGDMPVGQAIAKEMAGGGYDLLMTISTPSLQAVANANRTGKTPHVFGLVTDPYAAGVGINRDNHLDHPAYLAGYGTMQPVALAFQTAREMNPALTTVGVVWNTGEANSEVQIKLARSVCAQLGITLLEAGVENSAGVGESASALVARGVDALWVSGDVAVLTAIDSVLAAARKGRIPVFTVVPSNIKRGALFDLGADYFEVGRIVGVLAGEVLNGRSPASVAVENRLPANLTLNLQVPAGLKARWTIPASLVQRAAAYVDEQGVEHVAAAAVTTTATPSAAATTTPAALPSSSAPVPSAAASIPARVDVILYNETPPSEETLAGFKDGLARGPLLPGRDIDLHYHNAQGDMATLSSIIDAALTERPALLVPLSTPALQVALGKTRRGAPTIVFGMVANPVAAGAGRTYEDHLAHVTGISVRAPAPRMVEILKRHYPQFTRVGTLFCPSEVNSVDLKDYFTRVAADQGITVEAIAVNTPTEISDAALTLASSHIDAIVQISDNLSNAGFSALTRAARASHKPLISMNSLTLAQGSAISVGHDYHDVGLATADRVQRVLAGENPATIPFATPTRIHFTVNTANARATGLVLPEALLKEAEKVIND